MKRMQRTIAIGVALGVALGARAARAALGEPEASIAADREALAANSRGTTAHAAYTVHEMERGGTAIREYVSPSGVVFAIAWNGLANPDLAPLLSSYAEEYREAAKQALHPRGRRSQRIASAHMVVDRWGHMRDLHGLAYAPALVPSGVAVDELR